MNIGHLLFSFSGRINRGKFWFGYLIGFVLTLLALAVVGTFVPWDQLYVTGAEGQPVLDAEGNPQIDPAAAGAAILPAVLLGIFALISMYMGFALMVKRCHDRGKSGWWSLISLIPLAGFIWVIIDLGVMEGDEGPNQWGPNPLGNTVA